MMEDAQFATWTATPLPPHYVTYDCDVYLLHPNGRQILMASTNPADPVLVRIATASKIAYLLNKDLRA